MRLGVDREPAGGVDDDDVVLAGPRLPPRRHARPRPGRRSERVPSPVAPTASWPKTLPRSGAKTGTPARSPTTSSWVTALGRCRSAATSSGVWPWSLSHVPSLPARVVLPDPCRPASMTTVGGCLASCSWRVCPPRMPTSSSLTILTTCCAGLSAWLTSAPSARSRTEAMNALTTGSATSASSRARRMSRSVALTSCSVRRPLPRRFLKVAVRRSDREENTRKPYLPGRSPVRPRYAVWPALGMPCAARAQPAVAPSRGPSQVSMSRATTWPTWCGASGAPSALVR